MVPILILIDCISYCHVATGFAIPDWLRNREFSDCCLVPSYDLSRALISCKYYVSIRHVKDQKVIDHYYGKRINSIHANCGNDYHQWRIKHIDGEWVVLINRQTNKVLDHYYSKSVQAYYSNENHPAHQWKFVPMGPKQFAIVNRNSGAALIRNSGDDGVIGANMVTPFEAWELIPA